MAEQDLTPILVPAIIATTVSGVTIAYATKREELVTLLFGFATLASLILAFTKK
jgi:hypothetical protein